MNHIEAVRAALKATAPVVAIPVEGRVPVCIRARILKGALKGVEIRSVELLENGWLKVTGMAGRVHTCSKFAPIERWKALIEIREWSIREKEKRVRVINQGVLNAQTRRELAKRKIEAEADTALADAYESVQAVCKQARKHVNPCVYSSYDEGQYESLRATRHLRKRGSVIQWRLKQLREALCKITYSKGQKRGPKKTFATRREYIPRMVLLNREIAKLEAQFKALFPPVWVTREYWDEGGYWQSTGIPERPKRHPEREDTYNRAELAEQLREARGTIRALAPEEINVPEQIAA